MKSFNFDYYYGAEADQFTFLRIPRVLLTAPHFKCLSMEAKVLYGLMLDRMGLSIKNQWLYNHNRVYIYFTLDDVQANLSCGHNKGVKLLSELATGTGIGLIERVKQGQGKPTRIYVKNFNFQPDTDIPPSGKQDFRKAELQTSHNRKSRLPQTGSADFPKEETNYNNINQTYDNDIENQSIRQEPAPTSDEKSAIDVSLYLSNRWTTRATNRKYTRCPTRFSTCRPPRKRHGKQAHLSPLPRPRNRPPPPSRARAPLPLRPWTARVRCLR
jgi:hypothetical protein